MSQALQALCAVIFVTTLRGFFAACSVLLDRISSAMPVQRGTTLGWTVSRKSPLSTSIRTPARAHCKRSIVPTVPVDTKVPLPTTTPSINERRNSPKRLETAAAARITRSEGWGSGAPAIISGGLTNLNANSVAVRSIGHLKSTIRPGIWPSAKTSRCLPSWQITSFPRAETSESSSTNFRNAALRLRPSSCFMVPVSISILKTLLWANDFGCPIRKTDQAKHIVSKRLFEPFSFNYDQLRFPATSDGITGDRDNFLIVWGHVHSMYGS